MVDSLGFFHFLWLRVAISSPVARVIFRLIECFGVQQSYLYQIASMVCTFGRASRCAVLTRIECCLLTPMTVASVEELRRSGTASAFPG